MIPKLEVKGLGYSYHTEEGETRALSDISFSVGAGEFIAVVGPSGCGKSTLLSLLCGLIEPEEGTILFDGKPVTRGLSGLGYMLQKDHLFEWRTIGSNAALGLEIQHKLDDSHKKKVSDLLTAYGLKSFEDARPSELSGGLNPHPGSGTGSSPSRRAVLRPGLPDAARRLRRHKHDHQKKEKHGHSRHPRPFRGRQCRRPHPDPLEAAGTHKGHPSGHVLRSRLKPLRPPELTGIFFLFQ